MKDLVLSVQQLRILAEGINTNSKITAGTAERIYSSAESARSALMSLESWGYIVRDERTCGVFVVVKAPEEAFEMARNMKEAREKMKDIQNRIASPEIEVGEEIA